MSRDCCSSSWGFDALDSPVVVIVSTIIPLALATGLVCQHLASFGPAYLVFALVGFAGCDVDPLDPHRWNKSPVATIAVVHGVAGLTIFLLPILTLHPSGDTIHSLRWSASAAR
ncbi:MAG: hypothetical protein MZV64_60025 [Ignavibacteriales bacterium]|nr:hypothetical protein [Ignavibacteriales bacterium]